MSRMTIWSAGYKVRSVPPLADDKAMQIGSEFVGESFILVVSAATVLYEYNRSTQKEERKAAQRRAEVAAEQHDLQRKLHALDVRLQAIELVVAAESNNDAASSNNYLLSYLLQGGSGGSSHQRPQYVPPPAHDLVPITTPMILHRTTTTNTNDNDNDDTPVKEGHGETKKNSDHSGVPVAANEDEKGDDATNDNDDDSNDNQDTSATAPENGVAAKFSPPIAKETPWWRRPWW